MYGSGFTVTRGLGDGKQRAEECRTECEEHSCGSSPTYIRSDHNLEKILVPDPDTERWSDPNPE